MNKIVYNTYYNIYIIYIMHVYILCIWFIQYIHVPIVPIQYLYSHIGTYILTCKIIIKTEQIINSIYLYSI